MKGNTIIVVLLVIAIVVIIYLFLRKPTKNVVTNNGSNINTNNTGNVISPNLQESPSIKDYIGRKIIAPYDGIKVYYNYDLTEAKTFNKGETIGFLGSEETDNWVCPNRKGFYKVNDSGVSASCDVVISDSNVKSILGIK